MGVGGLAAIKLKPQMHAEKRRFLSHKKHKIHKRDNCAKTQKEFSNESGFAKASLKLR